MEEKLIAHFFQDGDTVRIQTVEEHCNSVRQLAGFIAKEFDLVNTAEIIGAAHDAGKASKEFQKYILEALCGKPVKRGSVNHSSGGAWYIGENFKTEQNDPIAELTKTIIMEAIISHHGLKDFVSPSGENIFEHQCYEKKLDFDAIRRYGMKELGNQEWENKFKKAIAEICVYFHMIDRYDYKNEQDDTDEKMFFINALIRFIISILIHADREDTRSFMLNIPVTYDNRKEDDIWSEAIDKLENKLAAFNHEGEINVLRADISEACKINAYRKPGIYRLSCPTGSGKTLSSMRYALYHAKKFKKKRIIYVAPYKTILTQNSAVIRSLFHDEDVLEHHSDFIAEDKEQYSYVSSNWSNRVIMTTAEQFYKTLFSDNTTSIRRFHQLGNAVILIDEVQSTPLKIISMFNWMLNFLTGICKSTIVLCSATQPVLDKVHHPIHLCENPDIISINSALQEGFKRVHYIDARKSEGFDYEEYSEFILECFEKHKSVLVIVNTKSEAKNIYRLCASKIQERQIKTAIYHLSTNMCPKHRRDQLDRVKKRLDRQENVICISTSLIDAGVDISVQCVIRSLTGLDSIIQAAGRCNRNKANPFGYVYIVKSRMENLRSLPHISEGQRIVSTLLYQKDKQEYIDEVESSEFINRYYGKYFFEHENKMDYIIEGLNETQITLWTGKHNGKDDIKGDKIPILQSALKTAGEKFETIGKTIGIIVPYGDRGKELVSILCSAVSHAEKYTLLKELQQYTVQVYEQKYVQLCKAGMVHMIEFCDILVLNEDNYNDEVGIEVNQNMDDLFV